MDDFIACEKSTSSPVGSGVEQLKRSAADGFVGREQLSALCHRLENEPDEFTRSTCLKLLQQQAERSCLTRKQLDRIDRHMAELRELTYRQVELVEKGTFKGPIVERALKLVATLNDLMANYQTLRRRLSSLAQ
jgi:HPt (histidine-containing phosphotransfer) domain-containing protein